MPTTKRRLLREALAVDLKLLGKDHRNTVLTMHLLSVTFREQGKLGKAEELCRKALAINRRIRGENHPKTLSLMSTLLEMLNAQKKVDEARALAPELIEHRRHRAEHPQATASELNEYSHLLLTCEPEDLRDAKTALLLAQKAVEMTDAKNYATLDTLAMAYQMTGEIDQAVETQRKALTLLPPDRTPLRTELETKLGEYLLEQENFTEAEPLLLAGYEYVKAKPYAQPKELTEALERLINLYEAWSKPEKAAEWRAKLPDTDPNSSSP